MMLTLPEHSIQLIKIFKLQLVQFMTVRMFSLLFLPVWHVNLIRLTFVTLVVTDLLVKFIAVYQLCIILLNMYGVVDLLKLFCFLFLLSCLDDVVYEKTSICCAVT